MQLKPMLPEDAPLVLAFMQQHYPPAYAQLWTDGGAWYLHDQYSPEKLHEVLAASSERAEGKAEVRVYWVMQGEAKVGWAQWEIKIAPTLTEKGAYLHRLYLATEAQGQGLGQGVLRQFEAFAKTKNLQYAWLEAMTLGGAIRFYEREGYQRISAYDLPYDRLFANQRNITILTKQLDEDH